MKNADYLRGILLLFLVFQAFAVMGYSHPGSGNSFIPSSKIDFSAGVVLPAAVCDMTVEILGDPGPPFCMGDELILTAVVTGGTGPFTFLWDTGDTTQSIPFTIGLENYHPDVVVTDAEGCTAANVIKLSPSLITVHIEWAEMVCEGDELELSVNIFPPFLGPQIEWSTGETGLYAYITESGEYSVTVTHPDTECSLSDTAFVEVNYVPSPQPEIVGPEFLCAGQQGSLSVNAGPPDFILWSTGSQQSTTTVPGPGIYTVLIVDENFCAGRDTFEIFPDGAIPELSAPEALCPGQSGTVEVVNDSDFNNFIWNTGGTLSAISVSGPGTYTVTVTSTGGCTSSASVTIETNTANLSISGNITPVTSCITPNGVVNISVTPAGTYTFDWSSGQTTEDIINLTAGNYTITITDEGGCTATASFSVPNNTVTPILTATVIPDTCGQSMGSVNLSITPAGSYSFLWSGGQSTEDLSNLSAGSFSVTVTSTSSGCTATMTSSVVNIVIDITVNGTITHPSDGQNNGAIDITSSPAGTYTFLWSNGATTEDITGLAPGTYTVTVSAGGTCSEVVTYELIGNSSCSGFDAFIAEPVGDVFCMGEELTLMTFLIGGTGPFTYQWSTGGTGSTETVILTGALDITVTVTDAQGCTSVSSQHIKPVLWWAFVEVIGDPVCEGEFITLHASSDVFTSLLWSTGETSSTIQVNEQGTYGVTLTDAASECTAELEVTPEFLPGIAVEIIGSDTICAGQVVTLSTIGGPFDSYTWSPGGQTTEAITVSEAGTYAVTVSNGSGCDGNDEMIVIIGTADLPILYGTETLCASQSGEISVINGESYSDFLWSTNETTSAISVNAPGSHTVTVTNNNGCTAEGNFVVMVDPNTPFIVSNSIAATCSESNGSINLSISPPGVYTFQWSNGVTTEDQSGIPGGNYAVTVTSVNGCTTTAVVSVPDEVLTISISGITTSNTSCSDANGTIDINVNPAASYTYVWSNGETTEDLVDIVTGTFSVTVTLGATCIETASFTVEENLVLPVISGIVTPNSSCDQPNGTIDLSVSPAGTYSFLWSNGEVVEDLIQLSGGTLSVTVTDSIGCTASAVFDINNINSGFSIEGTSTPNTSCENADGAIDVTIIPAGAYTYLWSNGAVTEDLQSVLPGTYRVTVTDGNTCSVIAAFAVEDAVVLPAISAEIISETCGNSNGFIDVTIMPAGNYLFSWSNGAMTEDLQNAPSGSYRLIVTDENACQVSDTFTIENVNNNFSISGIPVANTSCFFPDGSIDMTVVPVASYMFSWSNGETTEDLHGLAGGIYTVTVSDVSGCAGTETFSIENLAIEPQLSVSITSATCSHATGSIDLNVNPSGNYVFSWSNGSLSEDVADVVPGMYSVTVTGENGCTATMTSTVPDSASQFTLSVLPVDHNSCTEANGMVDLTVIPAGNYNYSWSNEAFTEDLQLLTPGIYVVTVTDVFGCSNSVSVTIGSSVTSLMVTETIVPALCGQSTGSIDLNVVPPSGNSYVWSDGSTLEDLLMAPAGTYQVTVTGENGCTWSSAFNVTEGADIEITLSADIANQNKEEITIVAEVNRPLSALDTVLWFPGNLFNCHDALCLTQTIQRPSQQTEIVVMVEDTNGCIAQASLMVEAAINPGVFIPNVFSPNGDGINDKFTVFGNQDVKRVMELRIFDRWGSFVFAKTDFPPNVENLGWDGSFRNAVMNPAVFVYWALVEFEDGSEGFYKGDVTLVR